MVVWPGESLLHCFSCPAPRPTFFLSFFLSLVSIFEALTTLQTRKLFVTVTIWNDSTRFSVPGQLFGAEVVTIQATTASVTVPLGAITTSLYATPLSANEALFHQTPLFCN